MYEAMENMAIEEVKFSFKDFFKQSHLPINKSIF